MTFRRHDVGGLPPLSPAFAIGLPVVLAGAWQAPALRRLLLLAAGYVLVAPVSSHYFLGIAPLWSVLIGARGGKAVRSQRGGHARAARGRDRPRAWW